MHLKTDNSKEQVRHSPRDAEHVLGWQLRGGARQARAANLDLVERPQARVLSGATFRDVHDTAREGALHWIARCPSARVRRRATVGSPRERFLLTPAPDLAQAPVGRGQTTLSHAASIETKPLHGIARSALRRVRHDKWNGDYQLLDTTHGLASCRSLGALAPRPALFSCGSRKNHDEVVESCGARESLERWTLESGGRNARAPVL